MAEVHTEGLQFAFEVLFTAEQSVPTTYYIGLATDSSLAEDASLSDITEVSGSGYERQTVTRGTDDFTSATMGTNDRKITTATVTFTATGTWTSAKTAFLATTSNNTGKLIMSEALSETRTLTDGVVLTLAIAINGIG